MNPHPIQTAVLGDFTLSTDPTLLQLDRIHGFLSRTYWAGKRSRETVAKSLENSLCWGVYQGKHQIAFARVITDYCTFAYLCDVFVHEDFRGRGISKMLMENILKHPELIGLRRFLLATKDAHSLYARYGFQAFSEDEAKRFMGIRNDDV